MKIPPSLVLAALLAAIVPLHAEELRTFRHLQLHDQFWSEGANFGDLNHDGKSDASDPAKPWVFHAISPNNKYGNFTHGMGVGDVNGDGRMDLIEKDGWWEQPASLAGDPIWVQHKWPFGGGGAQMYAYDVNGDGLPDIITSLAAHGFGLAWYEQYREDGESKFREHLIMGKEPAENKYGVKFSEVHALDLVDMDGDGLKDIVTGKRFWSHGRVGDPDRNDAAVLYWFKLVRGADKTVDFIPYLIDDNSGVGTQVVAGDINGDGLPDVIVGNKKGAFIHFQEKKTVPKEEWKKAQPKPLKAPGSATANPPAADLRPNFERWQLALRKQGARNTCSVFATVGAMEYAVARNSGGGNEQTLTYTAAKERMCDLFWVE